MSHDAPAIRTFEGRDVGHSSFSDLKVPRVREGTRGHLVLRAVSLCRRAGECRRQSHPAVPAAGTLADAHADLGQVSRVAVPRPASPAGTPCGPRVQCIYLGRATLMGRRANSRAVAPGEGRPAAGKAPRMRGWKWAAACAWQAREPGELVCVHLVSLGGRLRREARHSAAAVEERADLARRLSGKLRPSADCASLNRLCAFRPCGRVTRVTCDSCPLRNKAFLVAILGIRGTRDVQVAAPLGEKAEVGNTAMAAVLVLWGQAPHVGKVPPLESWQIETSADVKKVSIFP